MKRKVVLIHATLQAVQPMLTAFHSVTSDIEIINILDEGLLSEVNKQGGVTPPILDSFKRLLQRGIEYGADGILLSCSAFSPYVEELGAELNVPLVSADGAMLELALTLGVRIGVVATVETAGITTEQQIMELAAKRGMNVTIKVETMTQAFEELRRGNVERHDDYIRQGAEKLAPQSDILVLAQISMARAAHSLANFQIPVLTSPTISVNALLGRLEDEGGMNR